MQVSAGLAIALVAQAATQPALAQGWGGSGGSWQNGGFAGEIVCRSRGNREQFCPARTENRVVLLEQISQSPCIEGQTWRQDPGGVFVRRGCQGRFAYGYGYPTGWQDNYPSGWQDGRPSGWQGSHGNSGAAVAGGLLAAGLVAALVAAGKSGKATHNHVARVEANYGLFPPPARDEARACLGEAARQVGATGGDVVRLDRVVRSTEQPRGGWRLQAQLTKIWPDHRRSMRMDCVASGGRVQAFDVS